MADRKTTSSGRTVRKCALLNKIVIRQEIRARYKQVAEILKKPEDERSKEETNILLQSPEIVTASQKNVKSRQLTKIRQQETTDDISIIKEKSIQLAQAILSSKNLIVFTGAGISTAASIPDYRGPNGIWTLLEKGIIPTAQDLSDAEPTITHMALMLLWKIGYVKYIVSQNCDGLHLRSGIPQNIVSELHGNMFLEVCKDCKPPRQYLRLFDVTENTGIRRHRTGRYCKTCKSELRDTIVHFGEKSGMGSPYNWDRVTNAVDKCDMILCLGSSLKILKKYKLLWSLHKPIHRRSKLFIVNLQWTPKDDMATVKINGRCDEVMKIVLDTLNFQIPNYDRQQDPLFTNATHLTEKEFGTTSKKILKESLDDSNLSSNFLLNSSKNNSKMKFNQRPFKKKVRKISTDDKIIKPEFVSATKIDINNKIDNGMLMNYAFKSDLSYSLSPIKDISHEIGVDYLKQLSQTDLINLVKDRLGDDLNNFSCISNFIENKDMLEFVSSMNERFISDQNHNEFYDLITKLFLENKSNPFKKKSFIKTNLSPGTNGESNIVHNSSCTNFVCKKSVGNTQDESLFNGKKEKENSLHKSKGNYNLRKKDTLFPFAGIYSKYDPLYWDSLPVPTFHKKYPSNHKLVNDDLIENSNCEKPLQIEKTSSISPNNSYYRISDKLVNNILYSKSSNDAQFDVISHDHSYTLHLSDDNVTSQILSLYKSNPHNFIKSIFPEKSSDTCIPKLCNLNESQLFCDTSAKDLQNQNFSLLMFLSNLYIDSIKSASNTKTSLCEKPHNLESLSFMKSPNGFDPSEIGNPQYCSLPITGAIDDESVNFYVKSMLKSPSNGLMHSKTNSDLYTEESIGNGSGIHTASGISNDQLFNFKGDFLEVNSNVSHLNRTNCKSKCQDYAISNKSKNLNKTSIPLSSTKPNGSFSNLFNSGKLDNCTHHFESDAETPSPKSFPGWYGKGYRSRKLKRKLLK